MSLALLTALSLFPPDSRMPPVTAEILKHFQITAGGILGIGVVISIVTDVKTAAVKDLLCQFRDLGNTGCKRSSCVVDEITVRVCVNQLREGTRACRIEVTFLPCLDYRNAFTSVNIKKGSIPN